MVFALLGFVAVGATAWAQPGPGGPPGGGFGFGMGGFGMGGPGFGAQTPYGLLSADAVTKELKLTDQQKSRIKAINEKAQTALRDAMESMQDLEPAERQQKMPEIQKTMQTAREEQNKALQGALQENQVKRLQEIFLQLRGEQALRDPEVQNALGLSEDQKAKIRSIVEILTADQKVAFEKMKGEKFDMTTVRMGGRGGPGGFGGAGGPGGPGFGGGGERRRPAPSQRSE